MKFRPLIAVIGLASASPSMAGKINSSEPTPNQTVESSLSAESKGSALNIPEPATALLGAFGLLLLLRRRKSH